ncbi:S1C family serine protease [Marinobacter sp.]|uniref:S1C family serine protease n=1 Tax=Marinobacter sp. TaxID=50741 RepID=UPI00384BDC76
MNDRQIPIPRLTAAFSLAAALMFSAAAHTQAVSSQQPERLAYEKNTMEVASEVSASIVAVQLSGVQGMPASGQGMPGGSGFVVDQEGRIITNFHVVARALKDMESENLELASGASISIAYPGDPETKHPARILGANPDIDMAMLELEEPARAPSVSPVRLGDSDQVRVGQKAIVIGNPFGLHSSVTTGIVSAVERERPGLVGIEIPYIQTDAAINPGNSGGPVLNSAGEVIGISNAVLSPVGTFAGIGLAVPVNLLKESFEDMRAGGLSGLTAAALELPDRPRLGLQIGLTVGNYPPPLRQELQLPERGVVVTGVAEGGPADQAGIRGPQKVVTIGPYSFPVGMDVIIGIEGREVAQAIDVQRVVLKRGEGDEVTLTLWRDGSERKVDVELEVVKTGG